MIDYKTDETFCRIIHLVINSEGGFVDNPRDKGGPTKFGVAWNYNAGYLMTLGMRKADMKDLTLDQAKQLYYDRYWLPSNSMCITDVDLAYMHLDTAVNCGVGKASEFLSKLSKNPKHFDGRNGQNRTLFLGLFLEYTAMRLVFYTHCRDRDVFLAGWVNRVAKVVLDSLGLD